MSSLRKFAPYIRIFPKPMIEIEGLTKNFGPLAAVAGIDLSVKKGEVLGFLGPNGAGKSTTMKMITGYLSPSSGRVRVLGHDIESDGIAARQQIGYLPEGAPAYGDMTPRQFLNFIAQVRGLSGNAARTRIADTVSKCDLDPVLDQPIETLSKGFKRRVGLAQAILHDPPVLIMDEPTDGLDPNQKHAVRGLIRAMAPQKAIIVSTHLLEEVDAICTRAVIIDRGRIVADGTPAQLLARSKHHNAVTLTVAAGDAGAIKSKLKALHDCAGVEERKLANGIVELTAFPKSGALLIEDVSALAKNWNVKELYAEAGRLDEVFRAITTQDTARAREVRA
ncbi:MAG TPA: ABC transporter ATP-binding protein [Rhizomicrobium sp.]|nr:ABC transporter ATP-binding protein [Rhizomicrobium sp.]